MAKLLVLAVIALSASPLFARGPAQKLATPVFEDPTNNASIYNLVVGTQSMAKIYTPDVTRDEREVIIENCHPRMNLHVTTWNAGNTFFSSTVTIPASFVIFPSTVPNNWLQLPSKTTYYGMFEHESGGGSSATVRSLIRWWDQSLQP